jgi:membrane protein implicated in regulation of membrane protease activity
MEDYEKAIIQVILFMIGFILMVIGAVSNSIYLCLFALLSLLTSYFYRRIE